MLAIRWTSRRAGLWPPARASIWTSGFLQEACVASVGISPAWIRGCCLRACTCIRKARAQAAPRLAAVFVIGASVARAHEKLRLREPAHRAAKMGAVDGEDLKLPCIDAAHPAGDFGGVAVVEAADRTAEVDQPRLADGEVADGADGDPGASSLPLRIAGPSR